MKETSKNKGSDPARSTSTPSVDDDDRHSRWHEFIAEMKVSINEEKFDEAEHAGLRALEIAESYGRDDQRLGITLELLSQIYYRNRKFQYGAPVLMRLLQLYRRCLGQDHLDTGTVTHNAALLYHAWKKVDEAAVFYQQAMYIKSSKLGLGHPDVEAIRDDYAVYLNETKQLQSHNTKYKPLPNEKLSDSLGTSLAKDKFTLSGQFEALPKELLE